MSNRVKKDKRAARVSSYQLRFYKYLFSAYPTVSIIKSSDGVTCVLKKGDVIIKRHLSEVYKYG